MWTNGAGAVVAVAGNLLLVPLLGLWGAAISACLCYLSMAIMVTRRSQRHFPIEIRMRSMVPILLWLASGWALGIAVQMHPERFGATLRCLGLGIFYALPLALGFFPLAEVRSLFQRRGPPSLP
jgi:O-antigen/teichoic acid export membrane protein